MRDTENGHNDVAHVRGILLAGNARNTRVRGTRLRSEGEGVANGQIGEVHVNCENKSDLRDAAGVQAQRTLRIVDRLAAELLVHTVESDSLIVDAFLVLDEEAVRLASNRLEQSRATGTRTTKYDEHLALAKHALEVAENVDTLARLPLEEAANVAGQSGEHIDDVLLVVRRVTESVDVLTGYTLSIDLSN